MSRPSSVLGSKMILTYVKKLVRLNLRSEYIIYRYERTHIARFSPIIFNCFKHLLKLFILNTFDYLTVSVSTDGYEYLQAFYY